MKKVIFFFVIFCGLLFSQNDYQAKINIHYIFWHTEHEWRTKLYADLYFNDVLLKPGVDYDTSDNSYNWYEWQSDIQEWVSKGGHLYSQTTDGFANQVWQWKVQIIGPGFSKMSDPINVVKYGTIKVVDNINAFKENGSSANSSVKIREWAGYSWIDWTPQNNINRFLTLDEDNILKDSAFSLSGQKFHRWETISPATTYYNNHARIYIGDNTNDINVYHNRYGSTSFNLISEIPSLQISIRDPWLIKTNPNYLEIPYGYRNLGLNAIYENVNNGSYGGILLNQIDTTKPMYKIRISSSINLPQNGGTHNLYLQNWTVSGAALQYPNSLNTGVVFTSSSSSVAANVKATQLSDNQNTFVNNSSRKFIKTTDDIMHLVYESLGHVWYETSTDQGTTWKLMNNGQPLDNGEAKEPSLDFSNNSVAIVYQQKNGNNYTIQLKAFLANGSQYLYTIEL
ncbi:MAG: hypothetical protein WAM24_16535 [Ignavibacteriaceae bacterium]